MESLVPPVLIMYLKWPVSLAPDFVALTRRYFPLYRLAPASGYPAPLQEPKVLACFGRLLMTSSN